MQIPIDPRHTTKKSVTLENIKSKLMSKHERYRQQIIKTSVNLRQLGHQLTTLSDIRTTRSNIRDITNRLKLVGNDVNPEVLNMLNMCGEMNACVGKEVTFNSRNIRFLKKACIEGLANMDETLDKEEVVVQSRVVDLILEGLTEHKLAMSGHIEVLKSLGQQIKNDDWQFAPDAEVVALTFEEMCGACQRLEFSINTLQSNELCKAGEIFSEFGPNGHMILDINNKIEPKSFVDSGWNVDWSQTLCRFCSCVEKLHEFINELKDRLKAFVNDLENLSTNDAIPEEERTVEVDLRKKALLILVDSINNMCASVGVMTTSFVAVSKVQAE